MSTLHDLIINADNSTASLLTTYQVDGVGTDYSLPTYAMNTQSGFQNYKLPFPFSQVQQGKFVSFKFAVSSTAAWRFLGATLYFMPDRVPM